MSFEEVVRLTTLSRRTIYNRIEEGTFPATFTIPPRRVVFLRSEIAAWQQKILESRK